MTLAEIGLVGQRVDVLNGGDVAPDGRLLSVAEIQQAFRELVTRKTGSAAPARAACTEVLVTAPVPTAGHSGDTVLNSHDGRGDTTPEGHPNSGDTAALAAGWVSIVAAHGGAGASTVALTIADAAASAGRAVHLIETAHPTRSALAATTTAELGIDATGAWRHGRRGQTRIDRRADDTEPQGWPTEVEPAAGQELVLLDLGLPTPENRTRIADSDTRVVLVCRPTVPGVRLAEQLLAQLRGQRVVVAAVGTGKWPGEVLSSTGPLLRELRAGNRVVSVPLDRHLQVSGPNSSPLPKPVAAAGRVLLGLIDDAQPGEDTTTAAQPAPATKGLQR